MVADVTTHNIAQISTNSSITVTKPTGVVAGDLLVAKIWTTAAATFNTPAGWTLAATAASGFAATFYKIAGGSEPANYTFTHSNAVANTRALIYRVTGVDQTTPVQAATCKTSAATTTPTSDSVTAANPNTLHVVTCSLLTSNTTATVPSGMTQEVNDASTGQRSAVASQVVGSGATGAKTWTLGISASSATDALVINSAATGSAIIGSAKKAVTAKSVIIGGVKKPVVLDSEIIGGAKKVTV